MNLDFDALRTSRPDLKVGWDLLEPYARSRLADRTCWYIPELIPAGTGTPVGMDRRMDVAEGLITACLHLCDLGYITQGYRISPSAGPRVVCSREVAWSGPAIPQAVYVVCAGDREAVEAAIQEGFADVDR